MQKEKGNAASVKRIVEGWFSGLYDRTAILSDPAAWCGMINADPLPEAVAALASGRPFAEAPVFDAYNRFMNEKLRWREKALREGAADDRRMRKWRERQILRCDMEIGKCQNAAVIHSPGAFELSRGCSVGCWFCSLDAGPLAEVFRAVPENLRLWREMQKTMREAVGPAAAWSSCYWATEPFDNPDYEKFCSEFHAVHGLYPQTTTAVPLRRVERTRALLTDSLEKGCLVNRFSIHDADQLRGVFAAFTPLELLHTELLLENEETDMLVVRAGRAFDLAANSPERARRDDERAFRNLAAKNPVLTERFSSARVNSSPLDEHAAVGVREFRIDLPATTSCVSGFLTNLCAGTIELITPCAAAAEWPNGYRVVAGRRFADAGGFHAAVRELIRDCMPESVGPGDRVGLISGVNFRASENGFVLSTVFGKVMYESERIAAYLRHLGMLLHRGGLAAGYIAMECFYMFSWPENRTMDFIHDVFNRGLLDVTP